MMTSGRTFVRKKATLALLRVFSKYPDAIRVAFKRLVEKMDDPDPQVVSAAVSVLCELTLRDPRSYLPLAPEFYRLLESSTSNWLSIKLVKIFGALTPLEPRLGRKIAGLLCEQMNKTMAKSLLFECIRTVTLGLTDHAGAVKLAVEKLKEIMAQADPNLKYLGLQALAALMPVHPWAVADNKDIIVQCLNDGDPSIQRQSLVLIMGMISESNVTETVQVSTLFLGSKNSFSV
jgi:AP-3 complex subunit delta-1